MGEINMKQFELVKEIHFSATCGGSYHYDNDEYEKLCCRYETPSILTMAWIVNENDKRWIKYERVFLEKTFKSVTITPLKISASEIDLLPDSF